MGFGNPETSDRLTVPMRVRDWLATEVPRRIFSRLPQVVCRLPGPATRLALTFDDGPHPTGTPALLDVLDEHQVPAVFFLIGERARQWPELVREILARGHAIGNHSWTHADFWKCSKEELLSELNHCQQTLEDLAGAPVPWVRPPYGHVTWTVRHWARDRGARVVLWDLLPPDYSPVPDVDRLEKVYQKYHRSGSIICLHDNDNSARVTPQLLQRIIPGARSHGFNFSPLVFE